MFVVIAIELIIDGQFGLHKGCWFLMSSTLIQNWYWKKTVGDTGMSCPHVQLPQPSQSTPYLDMPESLIITEDSSIIINSMSKTTIKKLVREAGTQLMNMLLNKAAKPSGPSHIVLIHLRTLCVYHSNNNENGKRHAMKNWKHFKKGRSMILWIFPQIAKQPGTDGFSQRNPMQESVSALLQKASLKLKGSMMRRYSLLWSNMRLYVSCLLSLPSRTCTWLALM